MSTHRPTERDDGGIHLSRDELGCLVALLPEQAGRELAEALALQYQNPSDVQEPAFASLLEREFISIDDETVSTNGPAHSVLVAMLDSTSRLDWACGGGELPAFTKVFFHPVMSVVVTLEEAGARYVQGIKPNATPVALADAFLTAYEQYAGDEAELQVTAVRSADRATRTVNAVRADGRWEAARAEGDAPLKVTDVTDRAALLDLISKFLG